MNVLVQRGSLKRVTSVLAVTALTAGVGILGTAQPALANHGTVDTKAFGVDTNGLVNTAPTPLCPLVFGERFCEKEVAGVDVPGVLTTGVLKVRAEGTHDPLKADSEATVAEVVALPGTAGSPALTANLVTSRCTADEMGLVGDTVIADIDILGVEPTETELTDPPPNFEVVDIPGVLFIILNEQIISPNGEKITVNAIRIVAFPGDPELEQEIIISQSVCSFHPADAPPPAGTGFLEICKRADNGNGAVTGRFRFRFDGRGVTVPVGSCSGPIEVPAGRLTVREVQKDGVRMSGCLTRPVQRLLLCDPIDRRAVVRIVEGGVGKETQLFVTNKRIVIGDNKGAIKVCKIAGAGVKVGTNFNFTVGGRNITVAAGPRDQGGFCKLLRGFDRGSNVKVTEAFRSGVRVSRIVVQPADRKVSASKANRTATVRVGKGTTVVKFTNTRN